MDPWVGTDWGRGRSQLGSSARDGELSNIAPLVINLQAAIFRPHQQLDFFRPARVPP